jgi:hypothetical protein
MPITLSTPYNRRELIELKLPTLPELYQGVAESVAVRLEGKELYKRRPSVRLLFEHGGFELLIAPELRSSPTGWKMSEVIPITVSRAESDGAVSIAMSMYPGGGLTMGRWFKNPDVTGPLINGAVTALEELATDVTLAFTGTHGRCGMCKRPLSDTESMEMGIGPECRGAHRKLQQRLRLKPLQDFAE